MKSTIAYDLVGGYRNLFPTSVSTGAGNGSLTATVASGYDRFGNVQTVDGPLAGSADTARTRYPSAGDGTVSSASDYEQFGYDSGSNVTSFRNRADQWVTSSYDANGNLTGESAPAPYGAASYGYDNFGRIRSASRDGITVSLGYDALGRQVTEQGPHGTVSSQYNLGGERTRMSWPDGFAVDYDYDSLGAMTAIREVGSNLTLASFAYDNLGRRTGMSRGNGTTVSYTYDNAARFSSLGHDLAGTDRDQNVSFGYNPADQITSRSASNTAYEWTGHYNVSRAYAANGLNQYTSAGSVTLGYDAKGNLTASGSDSFGYDHLNRLVSASTGAGSASLSYDPLSRLYRTSGSVATRFGYDGADLIAEYNDGGGLLRRYVHGPGEDEPIVWYEGSGTGDRRWLAADERGSIVSVTNGSGGVIAVDTYDAWGIPGSSNLGRFQYTGQAWLPEVGMYHYKARLYSPTLGRFMQPDPIGYDDGMNIYAYVGNDPVNGWDSTGLCNNRTGPCNDDIVVTGRRFDAARWERAFDQEQIARLARGAAEFVPGYGAYECVTKGCGVGGWLLAGADFVPGGLLAKAGGKLLIKGTAALARTGKLGATARRLAGACTKGCFEAGTLVATPEGLVPIETIKVGDLVLSKNEVTGEVAPKPVTDLIRPEPKPLFEVKLRDASGRQRPAGGDAQFRRQQRQYQHRLRRRRQPHRQWSKAQTFARSKCAYARLASSAQARTHLVRESRVAVGSSHEYRCQSVSPVLARRARPFRLDTYSKFNGIRWADFGRLDTPMAQKNRT